MMPSKEPILEAYKMAMDALAIPSAEPTEEQVKLYCRNRDLVLADSDFMVHIIKGTPQAYIYKEMTNGEVIKMLYPQGEIVKGLYGISGNPLICVNLNISTECSEMVFTEDWWNSPYELPESEEV
jgi:hypothetical protein